MNTNMGAESELLDLAITNEFGLGCGAFAYDHQSVGLYMAGYLGFGDGTGTPQGREVIMSPPHSNDPKIGERTVPFSLSAGLTYGLTDASGIYVGASYGHLQTYDNYYDATHTLDPEGYYQVDGRRVEEWDLEYGMHLLTWGHVVLGVRRNLAVDHTFLTVGWGF